MSNTEYVAGVHSYVSGGCDVQGTAIRVSTHYDTFILPYINGTPYLEESCDACTDAHIVNGACTNDVATFHNTIHYPRTGLLG